MVVNEIGKSCMTSKGKGKGGGGGGISHFLLQDVRVIVLAIFKTQSIIWELKFLSKMLLLRYEYFSTHRVIG